MNTASTITWNSAPEDIPFDTPVLVRRKEEPVPFMVVRSKDYEPDAVSYLLGPSASPYGIYVDISELQDWTHVN